MKVPRPPRWTTSPRWAALRRFWHAHDLPCAFCRIEKGRWRR